MVRKPPTDSQHYCQTYDWRSLQMIPALSTSSSWGPRSGESEKWKWKSLSHIQLLATPWNSPGQNTGVGSLSLFQGILPTQGLNLDLPHCRHNLYQLSHRKPKNTGVSSLSLLQQIFLTQELNRGLLLCRQILYQLSYQGLVPCLNSWPAGTVRDNK